MCAGLHDLSNLWYSLLSQAKAIFQQIGYPDFILNQTQLEQYFAGVSSI